MSLLVRGNSKLGNEVYCFSLPPGKTCTPSDWCLKGLDGKPACYAMRNRFKFSNVKKSLQRRYEASKRADFATRVVGELKKAMPRFFRIHVSGDFYSEEYINKWVEICQNCPEVQFRTTTRRRDLLNPMLELNSLPNVVVRESLDPSIPEPRMGLKIAALRSLKEAELRKAYVCPQHCPECGYKCWTDDIDVCWTLH